MLVTAGTRLGPYEILAQIGRGGMGEVYRAKDTRLDRVVAIKVLPSDLSKNADLKQRFEREARTISRLSDPHICALYDIGVQEDTDFLVMEYLEGETLSDRLKKGPLPFDQSLHYGIQIAAALHRAHQHGIVHRDLKPGNIMLTRSGIKLLDFGLAKLRKINDDLSSASELPTLEKSLTQEGSVVGTLQYMSPEQLQGKEVDHRTDIFALGEILYEMATGRKAFIGENKASLITAILSSEPPPVHTVQPMIPPAIHHLISRCLAKDPDERWQNALDLATELQWIAEGGAQTAASETWKRLSARRERWAWALAILFFFVAVALIFTIFHVIQRPKSPDLQLFSVLLPERTKPDAWGSLAISPDGRRVAFVATTEDGISSIWVRSFHSAAAQTLKGTEYAAYPFWSPDSRFIGFFANGKLWKIPAEGGTMQALCDALEGRGGSWNKDGVILFGQGASDSLYRVSAAGGEKTAVTTVDTSHKESTHRWPYFLPDGNHFLYLIRSYQRQYGGIYLGSLDSKEKRRLLPEETRVEYDPAGFLIFMRGGNLMAQPFDPGRLQFTGDAIPIAEKVKYEAFRAYGSFSVSKNDVLAYTSAGSLDAQLVWWDRTGKEIGTIGGVSIFGQPALSPDEKRLLVEREDAKGDLDIWMLELSKGTFSRLTFNPSTEMRSSWSPDGRQIVFSSTRSGHMEVYKKSLSGGEEELLINSKTTKFVDAWSTDGRYVLYENSDPTTHADLWVFPMFGDRKPFAYLRTEFFEVHGQFSPDGKWIAYVSDESGRPEVYVSTFPDPAAGKWEISTNGGDHPQWRADGKELYYITPDKKLMAVKIEPGPTFEAGLPVPLFRAPVSPHLFPGERNQYVVTADGKRFLFNKIIEEASASPITVVLNWSALLRMNK